MQARIGVNFGHGSSPGRVRETNEDYHRVKTFSTPRGNLVFLAVADGMGGAAAGEHASKIAIEVVTEAIGGYAEFVSGGGAAVPLEKALEKAILAANRTIYKASLENPSREGMGTTLTVAIVRGRELVLGHVGDSRLYLLRRGEMRQLTKDHSWVADQVDRGLMTAESALNHQYRNLLVRALGTRAKVEPDVALLDVQPGDVYLLTSDGLHGLIAPEEFQEELRRGRSLQSAIDYWISLANQRGGPDNITGVIAQVGA